jgi:hypothetical protein
MLTPSKHLDLDRSTIRVSSEILAELRRRRMIKHDDLMRVVKRRIGDDGDSIVTPALSLLYALGCIEYHTKNDSFEYREKRESP